MDVIKQYEDYIGLKKEYIKNPTLENKNAMIAKLEEYGKYIYDQCNRLRKDCIVEEDTAYIRVVEGSIPSFPIASYGVNSNSIVPD